MSLSRGRGTRRRPQQRDHAVYAFDDSGQVRWRDVCSRFEGVYSLDTNWDGSVVVAGGWASCEPWAGFVGAWTADGVRLLSWDRAPSRINAVCVSADGRTLAAVGDALHLFRRRANEPFPAQPSSTLELGPGFAECVRMSDDGRWITTLDGDGGLLLFEHEDGELAMRHYRWRPPEPGRALVVEISRDGSWIVYGGADGTVHLFNRLTLIAMQRPIWSYPLVEGLAPVAVALSPDGEHVAVAVDSGDAGKIYYLANRNGAPHLEWSKQTRRPPTGMVIDGDSTWVAVVDADPRGNGGQCYLFEADSGLIAGAYRSPGACWTVALSGDGTRMLVGSDDGTAASIKIIKPDD
ncbi:hypothetical protein PPSIR1_27878 [Plesiocystis pacifica SIR-1]|uniref:WD40 repeat domain-containing protein n=1 Tax=Plesiocystis pacifica SIR-1 TaxID=391625 RepID=A6GJU0_9BACT|nr:WD40 repeat domain-containing protein [Plesiocystis pacifica]EDM73856.1 hypothetical protein PPSIR1_27878 [Plesiocystis pacifica SIR-1]